MSPLQMLSTQMQASLGGVPSDVVLTRPLHRRRGLVVDAETAEILEHFRSPTTVPEAVLLYAVRTSRDAVRILDDVHPVLRRLREARYLVRPEEAEQSSTRPLLSPGTHLGGWTVEMSLQVCDDSDVYRAIHDGVTAAIKLIRPGSRARLVNQLRREARVLLAVNDRALAAPRVLDSNLDDPASPAWLALSWVQGRTADAVAAEQRHRSGLASPDGFDLCRAVIAAYRDLHAGGFLHGDVHPGNMLVIGSGPSTHVTLVDFGLAVTIDGSGPPAPTSRGGIGWAFEPELAASAVAGTGDIPVSAAGEQYSLAAVCFYLLTGAHHLELPVERQAMFAEVAASQSRLLSQAAGTKPFTDADPAFARALALEPGDRFADIGRFEEALGRQASALRRRERRRANADAAGLVDRLAQPPTREQFMALPPPRSTLAYGAAGVALSLLRLAQLRGDPEMLSAADSWSAAALLKQSAGEDRYEKSIQITPESVTPTSYFYSTTGVNVVESLVAHAGGYFDRTNHAVRSFLAAVGPPNAKTEIVNGTAGSVLGGAVLLGALRTAHTRQTREMLERWLRPQVSVLARSALAAFLQPSAPLGLAHGLAGSLLAATVAESTLGESPSASVGDLATEFMRQLDQRPVEKWIQNPALAFSWCNGSAGVALALAAAARHTGDDACRATSVAMAEHAASYRGANASLCCGSSGIGFVLLNVAKALDDSTWADAASRQAELALATMNADDPRAHSLHKGALGPVLLAEEIMHRERAWFPGLITETLWR